MGLQFVFYIVAIMYFWMGYKNRSSGKTEYYSETKQDAESLKKMRSIALTEPLAEKTRPGFIEEIVGQEEGIRALRAALCGPNPQHIIVYGPPGVGKTAAARLVLDEAKTNPYSPFGMDAPFVEIDATTLRFDERSIADPLMGSVHDPIYQGAGSYGNAGIPQPKPGAVSRAHGGVLFIDEIGELHPLQMNKLLKVLEDRKVIFTSSYYNPQNKNTPEHIKDIFDNGMPADFRLIGATTRSPSEIPQALRSRCTEIFFSGLKPGELRVICENAIAKAGFSSQPRVVERIAEYSQNGRECVNIVQTAVSYALMNKNNELSVKDVEWVIRAGRYSPSINKKVREQSDVGIVNGLAVYSGGAGALLEIEATASPAQNGFGELKITGIIEEEEIRRGGGSVKRRSMARASVENVISLIESFCGINVREYNIHINFPGGLPADGPSAGIAMFLAVYSALKKLPIRGKLAMTGEVSLKGYVLPVGGVSAKIDGAREAGADTVLIPAQNWQEDFKNCGIRVLPVKTIEEALEKAFGKLINEPAEYAS
ncbi:MAG: ATP-dependent protease LonB [Firmicutes bacterium]|nr:ATP-dependent protease LonB [Bacillota bacterium]